MLERQKVLGNETNYRELSGIALKERSMTPWTFSQVKAQAV